MQPGDSNDNTEIHELNNRASQRESSQRPNPNQAHEKRGQVLKLNLERHKQSQNDYANLNVKQPNQNFLKPSSSSTPRKTQNHTPNTKIAASSNITASPIQPNLSPIEAPEPATLGLTGTIVQRNQVAPAPDSKDYSIEQLEKEIKELNQDLPKDKRVTSLADLVKKDQTKKKKKGSKIIWIIVGFVITVVLILVFWNLFLEDAVNFLVDLVETTNETSQPLHFLIFTGALSVMFLFGIPTAVAFVMILSFVGNSFILPAVYYVVSKLFVSTFHYFFIKKFIFEKMKKKYADSLLYRVVRTESQKRPLLASIMVQAFSAPPLVKNLIVTTSGVSFGYFKLGNIIYSIPYGTVVALAGMSLGSVDQILNQTSFSGKSTFSQIFTVVTYILGISSVSLIIFIICYTRKKVKQLKAELAEKEEKVKNLVKMLEEKRKSAPAGVPRLEGRPNEQERDHQSGGEQKVEINTFLEKSVIKEKVEEELGPEGIRIESVESVM